MRLGSALAVIRYNGGYSDVLKIFDVLGVDKSRSLMKLVQELDKRRVFRSADMHKFQDETF